MATPARPAPHPRAAQVAWAHPKFGSLLATASFDSKVIVWKEVSDNVWQQARAQSACHTCCGVPGRPALLHAAAGSACRRPGSLPPHPLHPAPRRCMLCRPSPLTSAAGAALRSRLPPALPRRVQVYVSPLHTASVNSLCWAPYELGLALAAASSDGSLSVLTYQPDGSWFAEKARVPSCWGSGAAGSEGGARACCTRSQPGRCRWRNCRRYRWQLPRGCAASLAGSLANPILQHPLAGLPCAVQIDGAHPIGATAVSWSPAAPKVGPARLAVHPSSAHACVHHAMCGCPPSAPALLLCCHPHGWTPATARRCRARLLAPRRRASRCGGSPPPAATTA